jgi:hypothetical protein
VSRSAHAGTRVAVCNNRPAAVDQASAQRPLGPSCPVRKLRTPTVDVSGSTRRGRHRWRRPARPQGVDVVSFPVRGWTVNEIPSTLGLSCPLDQSCTVWIVREAARPFSLPLASSLTQTTAGVVSARAAPQRPPASVRRGAPSYRCRRWQRRGARLAGGGGACRARGALHLSASLTVAARSSRTGLRLAHPRCERRPLLIYRVVRQRERASSDDRATPLCSGGRAIQRQALHLLLCSA